MKDINFEIADQAAREVRETVERRPARPAAIAAARLDEVARRQRADVHAGADVPDALRAGLGEGGERECEYESQEERRQHRRGARA